MNNPEPPYPPMFEQFLTAAVKEFQFLVDDHGFVLHDYSMAGYECRLTYRKLPNVALTIMQEAGSTPFVMLTLKKPAGSRGNRSFEVFLKHLAKRRVNEWTQNHIRGPTDEQIVEALSYNAVLLKNEFPEILQARYDLGGVVLDLLGRKQ